MSPEATEITLSFKVLARQADTGQLDIELDDHCGWTSLLRLKFDERSRITALDGNRNDPVVLAPYKPAVWYRFEISVNVKKGNFDVRLDGNSVLKNAELLDPVESL
jgi:hypothetical protein